MIIMRHRITEPKDKIRVNLVSDVFEHRGYGPLGNVALVVAPLACSVSEIIRNATGGPAAKNLVASVAHTRRVQGIDVKVCNKRNSKLIAIWINLIVKLVDEIVALSGCWLFREHVGNMLVEVDSSPLVLITLLCDECAELSFVEKFVDKDCPKEVVNFDPDEAITRLRLVNCKLVDSPFADGSQGAVHVLPDKLAA